MMADNVRRRAGSTPTEAAAAARKPGAKFIAGGTSLLDLIRLEIEAPHFSSM
jgi:xanthine dehydrogenase YagS FAD-binding subunit